MVFTIPTFSDIGKSCKDLFSKNFYLNEIKVEHKGKAKGGFEHTFTSSVPREGDKLNSSLEGKIKVPRFGFTFTPKFQADGVVKLTGETEDKLFKGFKATVEDSVDLNSGKLSAKGKTQYKHQYFVSNFEFDILNPGGKTGHQLTKSLVFGHKGYLGGFSVTFDLLNHALAKHSLALGWQPNPEFGINAILENGNDVTGLLYQKLTPSLEYGLQLKWNQEKKTTTYQSGFKYDLDNENSFKTSLNNEHQISLSFIHTLRKGIKLTLSFSVNARALAFGHTAAPGAASPHRFGLALEFDSTSVDTSKSDGQSEVHRVQLRPANQ